MKSKLLISGMVIAMLHAHAQAGDEFVPRTERPTSGPLAIDMKVNDAIISNGQVEMFMQTLISGDGDQEKGDLAGRRESARKELVAQEALAQAALARGMDKDVEVQDALSSSSREILSRVFIQDFFQSNPVTDEMIKTSYEWNRSNGKIMEYKVRQILLPTREQAEGVLARMKKGEKFIALTKLTKDPGANTNGGYIGKTGWFRPDIFVDPYLGEAIEKLPLNVPSTEPVRTRFGWHLLLVEEKRKVENPEPFDKLPTQALEALRQKTAQRQLNELIRSVAHKAKLTDAKGSVIDLDTLKPAAQEPAKK